MRRFAAAMKTGSSVFQTVSGVEFNVSLRRLLERARFAAVSGTTAAGTQRRLDVVAVSATKKRGLPVTFDGRTFMIDNIGMKLVFERTR